MELAIGKRKLIDMAAEQVQKIGNNVYLQWSIVAILLSLTAFVITFKVTTESEIRMLHRSDDAQMELIEDMRSQYPTKDWINNRLQQMEIKLLEDKIKSKQ